MDNKKNKPVAIVLTCYNSGIHLALAIESIINNTKYPWKLILIESESTDGTNLVCDNYASKYKNIRVIHTKKEGITKATNVGIKAAGELDVYLTQDDVVLPNLYERDWLTVLVEASRLKKIGAVSTFGGGGVSGPECLDGFKWVGTWSLFLPRKTIKKIGLFDENYSPGPYDDIDYSIRLAKAGVLILIADFWVDHHRKTNNFNDKLKDVYTKNSKYFKKKWGIK